MIGLDVVGFDPRVIEELKKGRLIREVIAMNALKREQAQFNVSPIGEHKSMEGLGRIKMSIPPLAYHYWGQRLGYSCWSDRKFQDEFLRDNASVRVKQAGGTKTQIMSGFGGSTKRFRKKYDEDCFVKQH